MDTTEDRATSSNKPVAIKKEEVELDNWLANFSGVAAAEESAQETTTQPLTFENLAKSPGERPMRSQEERSSQEMGRKATMAKYTTAKRLKWMHHYVEKVEFTGTSGMIFTANKPNEEPRPVNTNTSDIPACFVSRLMGNGWRTGMLTCNPRYDQNGQLWEHIGRAYKAICILHNIDFWKNNRTRARPN